MKLVRGAWKLLVAIKDALVLVAMLLFFGVLFAALTARQKPAAVKDGALVLDLDGPIVEQPEEAPPLAMLSGQRVGNQYRLRDVVRTIAAAKDDKRVKAVVLDLDRFGGAYPAALDEVAQALLRVRQSGKPVLAYATGYTDSSYRLAAAASEVWVDPMGGVLLTGPGGAQPYYKGLFDKLGVNAHIYRVGKYKSAVEPYSRAEASPEAREEMQVLYGDLFGQWREWIARARPKAQLTPWLTQPDATVKAAGGDVAKANLSTGLVDQLGDRVAFGRRVAALAGGDDDKPAGWYRSIRYANYVAANPLPKDGQIGIVTVAGDIVDGKAGPGTAGGDTIADQVLKALATNDDLKAIVLRVDSPGGSAMASERIRLALLEAKKKKLPVVVSMGGLAASGGYWVSTAGDTIFAEPTTITGSIGIFGIIPTFEKTLAKVGVTTDGVRTTPLSGQPDVMAGTNPTIDGLIQSGIEHGYAQFVARVSQARKLSPARVNEIGQGRVWTGGAARQIGLVDRFGTLDDAVAEAAKRAGIDPKDAKVVYLEKKPGFAAQLAQQIGERSGGEDDEASEAALAPADIFARVGWQRQQAMASALGDARRMLTGASIRAQCLECAGLGPVQARTEDLTLFRKLLATLGL